MVIPSHFLSFLAICSSLSSNLSQTKEQLSPSRVVFGMELNSRRSKMQAAALNYYGKPCMYYQFSVWCTRDWKGISDAGISMSLTWFCPDTKTKTCLNSCYREANGKDEEDKLQHKAKKSKKDKKEKKDKKAKKEKKVKRDKSRAKSGSPSDDSHSEGSLEGKKSLEDDLRRKALLSVRGQWCLISESDCRDSVSLHA